MATQYKFWCELLLEPMQDIMTKNVAVKLDGEIFHQSDIPVATVITLEKNLSAGPHDLTIDFHGKSDVDRDQALKISRLQINGISDRTFIWQADYHPCYPEPWRSQQEAQGHVLPATVKNADYLGWNGTWNLRFTAPVYTWIHQTQNLGWIYD